MYRTQVYHTEVSRTVSHFKTHTIHSACVTQRHSTCIVLTCENPEWVHVIWRFTLFYMYFAIIDKTEQSSMQFLLCHRTGHHVSKQVSKRTHLSKMAHISQKKHAYLLITWCPVQLYASSSDVKSSRPSCPRGQNFVLGLGLEDLFLASDSASSICPRTVLELFMLASSTPLCLSSLSSFMVVLNYLLVYEV